MKSTQLSNIVNQPKLRSGRKPNPTVTKAIFLGLPKRRKLLATSAKPIRCLVIKLAKKLLRLKVSTARANRVLGKLIAVNRLVQARRLDRRRNVFGLLPLTKRQQARLRASRPKHTPTPWHQYRRQRRLAYLKRKAARRKRYLKWRTFRLRRRWKRSIARRFAKSFMLVHPNPNLKFEPFKRRLTNLRSMVELHVRAVATRPAPSYRYICSPDKTTPPSTMVYRLPVLAKDISADTTRGFLIHELRRFTSLDNGLGAMTSIQSTPAEELLTLHSQPTVVRQRSVPRLTKASTPLKLAGLDRRIISALTRPRARVAAMRLMRRAIKGQPVQTRALVNVYRRSLYGPFNKASRLVSRIRRVNCTDWFLGTTSSAFRVSPTRPLSQANRTTIGQVPGLGSLAISWELSRRLALRKKRHS